MIIKPIRCLGQLIDQTVFQITDGDQLMVNDHLDDEARYILDCEFAESNKTLSEMFNLNVSKWQQNNSA
jgi:hypothetical protein